ncbi:MAG: electron transfer flavoprotein subunit alpha/FixB family protein [Chloroflexota bacterium]
MSQDIFVVIEHLRGQVADISYTMLAAGRSLAAGGEGKVVAVLLGHNAQGLAANLNADQVYSIDDPVFSDFNADAYRQALMDLISKHVPRLVLFGDTSIGSEVACLLAAHLDMPIVSYCRSIHSEDGTLKFTSQVCGGKIMVKGDLPAPTVLVMMIPGGYKPEQGYSAQPPEIISVKTPALQKPRVTLKQYIEPDASDIDITKEPILISIGRGIQNQDNIALAQELADALGGVLSASRPVVDQGWLPATRLVGKSGKRVKAKVYLTLGISGAPEHVEAITNCETVVAVNTDPGAPIFEVAQYGIEADLLDLLPVLTEAVQQAKGG